MADDVGAAVEAPFERFGVDDVELLERGAAGTFVRSPVERSSTTSTSSPRARNASATCEPMKPAPPVTIDAH